MKKWNRILAAVLTLSLTAGLTACGGSTSDATANNASAADEGTVSNGSSFQLRSISSVLETMPLRRRILLLSQRDHRSSTLMYGLGYLSCGTGQRCSAIIYHTRFWILPVCRQRSFPVSRTGGYGIHHVPRYRVLLFPYGNMESKKSVCMVIFLHR